MSTAKLLRWSQEHTVYSRLDSTSVQPRGDHAPPSSEESQNTQVCVWFDCKTSCYDVITVWEGWMVVIQYETWAIPMFTLCRWYRVNLIGTARWLVLLLLTVTVTTFEFIFKTCFSGGFILPKKPSADFSRFEKLSKDAVAKPAGQHWVKSHLNIR